MRSTCRRTKFFVPFFYFRLLKFYLPCKMPTTNSCENNSIVAHFTKEEGKSYTSGIAAFRGRGKEGSRTVSYTVNYVIDVTNDINRAERLTKQAQIVPQRPLDLSARFSHLSALTFSTLGPLSSSVRCRRRRGCRVSVRGLHHESCAM